MNIKFGEQLRGRIMPTNYDEQDADDLPAIGYDHPTVTLDETIEDIDADPYNSV